MNINEQYLTVKELSIKIKYSRQTIYNMIHQQHFVKGKHYIKPSRKKILFLWSAIHNWLNSSEIAESGTQHFSENRNEKMKKTIINI